MKRILTIFIGGTICTTIKNGIMNTDSVATTALVDSFKKSNSVFKDHVEITEGKSFGILSENMTVDTWNVIIEYFQSEIKNLSKFDGIIIAHGTDTLAYTTSLFSILLKGFCVPVVFVSSNYSIMQENGLPNHKANGRDNYRAAVECICQGIAPGVYATYKNPKDGRMYLHNGAHLIQCSIYDENFYSADAVDITDFNGIPIEKLWQKTKADINSLPIMTMAGKKLNNCILKINPYTGLNYDMFDISRVKAVFHGTYHSGTACVVKTNENPDYHANNSILYFFDKCANYGNGIPFYYSPSRIGEEFNVYASVPFIEHHISNNQSPIILYGQTDELMYVKLLFAYSTGMTKAEIELLLKNE